MNKTTAGAGCCSSEFDLSPGRSRIVLASAEGARGSRISRSGIAWAKDGAAILFVDINGPDLA